jgi:hypothetical protein
MKRYLVMLALVGCAGDFGGSPSDAGNGADGGPGDALNPGCTIAYDPMMPVASAVLPIRAYTTPLNPTGVVDFTWSVYFGTSPVSFNQAATDGSQISFLAPTAGIYRVVVDLTSTPQCPHLETTINVGVPGANADVFRVRTVAAPSVAPPQEVFVQVKGGADADRPIVLDGGITTTGLVKSSLTNAGIPAYLKFMPRSMPTAFSEQFASATGAYSLRLLQTDHDVLVIPSVAGLAPKLVPWTALPVPTAQLVVGAGTAVTGVVRNPAGGGLAGAKVQLYAGGVPSTLATTAADGTFTVRTDFPSGAVQITVKVTPPATSGLPRLEATNPFTLAGGLTIAYAGGLTTCDLASVPVRRSGTNLPGSQVTIVGSVVGNAGTINGIGVTNTVRVVATADGTGRLPSTIVPRGALSAVTKLSAMDHAVSSIDTSACAVAEINAPAMTAVSGTTRDAASNVLDGIRVEAEPAGALALAGVAPIHTTANATGMFVLPLAGNGRYNVRFSDPQQRAAPLVAADVAPAGVPTNAQLAKAIAISGTVSVISNTNPVIGASVQLLCATCGGLDIARPIAETATDVASRYRLAVPDPGTM